MQGFYLQGVLIEVWGRGTINFSNECKKTNLSELLFQSEFGGISVILFKDKYNEKYLLSIGLNKCQIKAVLYTKENVQLTNSIYQEICDTSERTALRDLGYLTKGNIFEKHG